MSRLKDPAAVRKIARKSLFEGLDRMCEGAIIVDREARIVWISDKYAQRLNLASAEEAAGRVVEDVIPNSLMREVVRTGEPMMLDIMQFGADSFVVMRVPVKDERGKVVGAAGFMLFDRLQHLQPLVSKFRQLETRLADIQKSLAEERRVKYTFSSFIGSSPSAMEVKRQARRAAQADTTVLLLGETGTGKEVLAQAIHSASPRAHGPFIGVNVAAIPDALLEAEFFGIRGAPGKFRLAQGGTLFLDEVGDIPLAMQARRSRIAAAGRNARSRPPRSRCFPRMRGRATSASCATCSSKWPSTPTTRGSRRRNSRWCCRAWRARRVTAIARR